MHSRSSRIRKFDRSHPFFSRIAKEAEVQPEEDDTIDYIAKDKMFVCDMDVAAAFHGILIGKSAETKQKIEQETNTQIVFPRRDEVGMVKIRGRTKANVQSARSRMEIIIDRNRQIQPLTHFISLPICQSAASGNIKEKYEEFKRSVLEQCAEERGVNSDLFQHVNKLHLTVSTLVLLSKSEVDFIKETLQDCTTSLLRQLMPTDKDRFLMHLKGLEFMNDDSSFVDVLYAKVQQIDSSHSDRLRTFLDRLNEELSKTGLMKQKFERLKLHVTMMNSLLRKDDTGILEAEKTARGRVKNADRESFDAKKILRLFGQFDFGIIELDELHLSIMHEPNRKTGYYGCEMKIPLKPIA